MYLPQDQNSKLPPQPLGEQSGHLLVNVLKGKIYRNTELFGEMDPFVVIEYKGSKHQTSTIDEGGVNPVWNQALKFPVETQDDLITISCYDEDTFNNDALGTLQISIRKLLSFKGPQWLDLNLKDEKTASIYLSAKFKKYKEKKKSEPIEIKED